MKASLYCVYAGLLIMGGMWWKMFDELRDAQADVRELRAEVAAGIREGQRRHAEVLATVSKRLEAAEAELATVDLEVIDGRILLLEVDSRKFQDDIDQRSMQAIADIAERFAGTKEQEFGRDRALWHAKRISFEMLKPFGGASAFVDRAFLEKVKQAQ